MPTFNQEKLLKLKRIDNFFKAVYFFPKNKKQLPPIDNKEIKELLIIGFLLIGDTIMYSPAMRVIKKNFPHARITIICDKATEIILKDQNVIDKFIIIKCPWIVPFDTSVKNLRNFFGAIKIANKIRYNFAIDFRGDWRNIFYMNFIRSERKISFGFSGGEYMLTDVIKPNENIKHFTEESFYLLEQLGCSFTESDKLPYLDITQSEKDYLSDFKLQNDLNDRFLIGVHPGTSQEVKRWAEDKYSELIKRTNHDYRGCTFIIYEGPGEKETVAKIVEVLTAENIAHVVVNRTLKEYILLLSLPQLIICNDSGAAHIAGAYGIATLMIFGNVDPVYVTPYGAKFKKVISHQLECKPCYKNYCMFGHKMCIAGVSVDEVYDATVQLMSSVYRPVSLDNGA